MYLVGLVVSALSLSACISAISPQTADTLAPGEMSGHVALSTPVTYYASKSESTDDSSSEEDEESSASDPMDLIWFDVGTRYGLSDNLDVGVEKTGLITRFDIKRRLLGNGKGVSMAIGAGVGSNNLAGFLNSEKSAFFMRTSDIPLYVSARIGESSSLYSTLRYHYTHIESRPGSIDLSDSNDSSTSTETDDSQQSISARNVALSVGGIFGEPVGFFIEFAAIKGMDKEFNNATRPQLALGFTLRNSVPKSSADDTQRLNPISPIKQPKKAKPPKR